MKLCYIIPCHQVLNNEASAAYNEVTQLSGMTYQLVPPDDHRQNLAEKSIQTWKNYIIGVLSGMDDSFLMHLWCQLIPQAERQLLLIRQSYTYPTISVYAYLYAPHDYTTMLFIPIGMEALIHEKPN